MFVCNCDETMLIVHHSADCCVQLKGEVTLKKRIKPRASHVQLHKYGKQPWHDEGNTWQKSFKRREINSLLCKYRLSCYIYCSRLGCCTVSFTVADEYSQHLTHWISVECSNYCLKMHKRGFYIKLHVQINLYFLFCLFICLLDCLLFHCILFYCFNSFREMSNISTPPYSTASAANSMGKWSLMKDIFALKAVK